MRKSSGTQAGSRFSVKAANPSRISSLVSDIANVISSITPYREFMDRVLLLGGMPNLQRLDAFQVGETVVEALDLAISLETRAVEQLQAAVRLVEEANDFGTMELLSPKVPEEEGQLDWLRTQKGLIEQLGEQLYLSLQVGE